MDYVNILKTSEAANFVFQRIFVLNSVKHKFFPVSIVNELRSQISAEHISLIDVRNLPTLNGQVSTLCHNPQKCNTDVRNDILLQKSNIMYQKPDQIHKKI